MKKIAYQLCSSDPNNYGTVTFTPLIPWNCEKVMWTVTDLNTFSNIVLSNESDYILVDNDRYNFVERTSWDIEELANWLTKNTSVTVTVNDCGCYRFSKAGSFTINGASHRVKLLLGLFHCREFPLRAVHNEATNDYTVVAPSCPMLTYANVLYLRTLEGTLVGTRSDINNITLPCAYRVNSFIKPGVPLIYHKKGEKVVVNVDAARQITVTLVDFMYEPVILKSPMFIAIKIKPVKLCA